MKIGMGIPSFIHQTDSLVRPPAPREPNGEPLSQRIPCGRPYSQKPAQNKGGRPRLLVPVIRSYSIRKRVRLSVVVNGSIRCWSRVRNQPLKSRSIRR